MYPKKLVMFIAASVMAFFLGAISASAQGVPPPPPDADLDGVPDEDDECPNSNLLASTVLIESCDTGIPNTEPNLVGCTFADLIDDMIADCAADAKNHGKFVSCVAHATNALKRARTISGRQKGKIQSCAARSTLP